MVMEKLDKEHSAKLKNVVNHYEKLLKEEAEGFKKSMVDEISNYIELYIDKTIPARQIAEACENSRAKKIVEQMKSILAIDEDYINENIREALQDGKKTITTLHKELNEAVKENVKINRALSAVKADLILEKKTQHMSRDKQSYVRKILSEKSPEYISENFDYVVEMFERDDDVKTDLLVEEAKKETEASKIKSVPRSEILSESITDDKGGNEVSSYLTEMSKIDNGY